MPRICVSPSLFARDCTLSNCVSDDDSTDDSDDDLGMVDAELRR